MKIRQLSLQEIRSCLALHGLRTRCGPFNISLRSNLPQLAAVVHGMYGDFPQSAATDFVDFEVTIQAPTLLRRLFRQQVSLSCDGRVPFKPLPMAQAFPMLEWGLNWVLSSHAHGYLVLHAAVVEKDGRALILAADPGSGKSTLCAALVHNGWRLLSDELALVSLASGRIQPIARPISLKNASIELVRAFGDGVTLSPVSHGTAKGSIAHMKPPENSVDAMDQTAAPALVVFPRFARGEALSSETIGPAHAFLEVARHAFNLSVLAEDGFDAIAHLIENVRVSRVSYSSFAQVIPEVERLWREAL